MASKMDREHKSGLMEPNMKESGKMIKPMATVNLPMPMAMSMKATGATTKLTGMGSICMRTERHTQEIGLKTSKRGEE